MTVLVKLSGDADDAVASAAALGIRLRPAHPGSRDPELSTWFIAESSGTDDETVVSTLRTFPATEAAYTKPPDELPGGGGI
ncbi:MULTISPECIES: hypothetical protein [unclassified Kribbella]|uniref:hypothetical protein n=1 Tax=unclassified Kribbella TaxID=2644121 RepID=UPI0030198900